MSKDTDKLTIHQFKAWLEGVEEMQEEGWTPSPAQWEKIRSKIAILCENIEQQQAAAPQVPAVPMASFAQPAAQIQSAPPQFPAHNPRPLDNINPNAVTQQSSLTEEVVQRQRAPAQPRQAPAMQSPNNSSSGEPQIVTPNIDTSDGNYKSGFE